MKLRQLKRKHIKRLRRRIARAELRQQFDQASSELAGALADAILAPGRLAEAVMRQMVREIVAPIAQAIAASGDLPGSSVGGVTSAAVDMRDTDPPMTIGLIPAGTRIEGSNASGGLQASIAASIASVIAMAGDELTKG